MIDQEIIEECRKGNLQEFGKIVESFSPFAFSVAFRMIGNDAAARDIVQETMINVWRSIRKIKTGAAFKTWVYRIVINKCYDEMRRRKRNPEFTADDRLWLRISQAYSENPSKLLEESETAALIQSLAEKLSPKQKAVFILADLEEMPADEISAVTGMSRSSIKANLHYARLKIREMIEKRAYYGQRG